MHINRTLVAATLFGTLSLADIQPIQAEPTVPAVATSTPVSVFQVANPGELAQSILAQGLAWTDIQAIKVSGTLNETDLSLFKRMTNLTSIDLSGATIKALPDYFVQRLEQLNTVKLPALETIGASAFGGCTQLTTVELSTVNVIEGFAFYQTGIQSITLPVGLKEIQNNAFEGAHLSEIELPEGLETLPPFCFKDCEALTKVTLPTTLTTIEYEAFANCGLTSIDLQNVVSLGQRIFANCSQLSQVRMGDALTDMHGEAFLACTALTTIELPSMVHIIGEEFNGCSNLKQIYCKSITPPETMYCPMGEIDMSDIKLYVPAPSVNLYRNSSGWSSFYNIYPPEQPLSYAFFNHQATIDQPTSFAPDGGIMIGWRYPNSSSSSEQQGEVTYTGTTTLRLGNYIQSHLLAYERGYSAVDDLYQQKHTTLIANGPIVADKIETWLNLDNPNYWYFLSFPYDVKLSDICTDIENVYVIRKYNSYNRAYQTGTGWENLTGADQMNAYEGYILSTLNAPAEFYFPAVNNTNKNNLFATESVSIKLKDYPSSKEQHRSWNFIGNPYPCYFRIDKTDFTAPITVYVPSKSRYEAYSPIDDPYVLQPNEAFFVQKPYTQSAITFNKEGRMNKSEAMAYLEGASLRSSIGTTRQLYNLWLFNDTYSDRTRFVINEQASRSYELDKDASKFIEADNQVPLLYTVENEIRYAINERPLSDGQVQIGYYAPSRGTYRIQMSTNSNTPVWITDQVTGKTQLFEGVYSFEAEAGYHDNRFTVTLGDAVASESIQADQAQIQLAPGQIQINEPYALYTPAGQLIGHYAAGETAYVKPGIYLVISQHVHQLINVKS